MCDACVYLLAAQYGGRVCVCVNIYLFCVRLPMYFVYPALFTPTMCWDAVLSLLTYGLSTLSAKWKCAKQTTPNFHSIFRSCFLFSFPLLHSGYSIWFDWPLRFSIEYVYVYVHIYWIHFRDCVYCRWCWFGFLCHFSSLLWWDEWMNAENVSILRICHNTRTDISIIH